MPADTDFQNMDKKQLDVLQKELTKVTNKREELSKQFVSLNKDHTTLTRKLSSLHRIFETLDETSTKVYDSIEEDAEHNDETDLQIISQGVIERMPQLEMYNDVLQKIDAWQSDEIIDMKDIIKKLDLPIDLITMIEMHDNTALLYKDSQNYVE
ncbi:hypothetical protein ACO0QE_004262 [Hanseniaspora vineae]